MITVLSRVSVFFLCLFSVAVSIQVWVSFANNAFETSVLTAVAIGVELAKITLIAASVRLWNVRHAVALLTVSSTCLLVCVNVFTTASYFDSRAALQQSLHNVATVQQSQNEALQQLKLNAAKEYQSLGMITKSVEVLQQVETPATPHQPGALSLRITLPETPAQRFATFATVALIIDATVIMLIVSLVSFKQQVTNDATVRCNTGETLQNTCNTGATAAVLAMTPGADIGVRQLMNAYGLRHDQVNKILRDLTASGEVVKRANKYIRSTPKQE